jgi:hypothetical protein
VTTVQVNGSNSASQKHKERLLKSFSVLERQQIDIEAINFLREIKNKTQSNTILHSKNDSALYETDSVRIHIYIYTNYTILYHVT